MSENENRIEDHIDRILKGYVDFAPAINLLRNRRQMIDQIQKDDLHHDISEYCYHLVSVLMESERLINDKDFAYDYIQEHLDTLSRYSKMISEEKYNANRKKITR